MILSTSPPLSLVSNFEWERGNKTRVPSAGLLDSLEGDAIEGMEAEEDPEGMGWCNCTHSASPPHIWVRTTGSVSCQSFMAGRCCVCLDYLLSRRSEACWFLFFPYLPAPHPPTIQQQQGKGEYKWLCKWQRQQQLSKSPVVVCYHFCCPLLSSVAEFRGKGDRREEKSKEQQAVSCLKAGAYIRSHASELIEFITHAELQQSCTDMPVSSDSVLASRITARGCGCNELSLLSMCLTAKGSVATSLSLCSWHPWIKGVCLRCRKCHLPILLPATFKHSLKWARRKGSCFEAGWHQFWSSSTLPGFFL